MDKKSEKEILQNSLVSKENT